MLSAPLAVAFLVILYRESQYNKIYGQQERDFMSFSLQKFTKNIAIDFKGSSDLSHLLIKINVGKGRIRHRTTLSLNDHTLNRF